MTIENRLFPATVMPDQDWWHALWPNSEGVIKDLHINSASDA